MKTTDASISSSVNNAVKKRVGSRRRHSLGHILTTSFVALVVIVFIGWAGFVVTQAVLMAQRVVQISDIVGTLIAQSRLRRDSLFSRSEGAWVEILDAIYKQTNSPVMVPKDGQPAKIESPWGTWMTLTSDVNTIRVQFMLPKVACYKFLTPWLPNASQIGITEIETRDPTDGRSLTPPCNALGKDVNLEIVFQLAAVS